MPEAYIVDAVRTPVGKRGGGLSAVHPADLGAHVITALVERTGVDPQRSRTSSSGASTRSARRPATSPARAGSPPACPTRCPARPSTASAGRRSRRCTSPPRRVMSGTQRRDRRRRRAEHEHDPDRGRRCTAAEPFGFTDPFSGSEGWRARYGDQEVSQFRGAEMIAEKWDISREDMEAFALESHRRAVARHRRGPVRARDRPLRRRRDRRGAAARHVARADGVAARAGRGRPAHRGGVEPDLRRRRRDARRLGARP